MALILRTAFSLCVRVFVCTDICVLCVCSGHTGGKRASEPLELELQLVGSSHVVLEPNSGLLQEQVL